MKTADINTLIKAVPVLVLVGIILWTIWHPISDRTAGIVGAFFVLGTIAYYLWLYPILRKR